MNWKTWVPLILAIVLGVAAAKVARDQIMKTRLASGPAGKFVQVVVAKGDINPGKPLTPEDLTLAQVQENAVPANGFKKIEDLTGRDLSRAQDRIEFWLALRGTELVA